MGFLLREKHVFLWWQFVWHVANVERGFVLLVLVAPSFPFGWCLWWESCVKDATSQTWINYTPKNQHDKLEITIYFSRRYIDSFMDDFPACHASFQECFRSFWADFPDFFTMKLGWLSPAVWSSYIGNIEYEPRLPSVQKPGDPKKNAPRDPRGYGL